MSNKGQKRTPMPELVFICDQIGVTKSFQGFSSVLQGGEVF